MGRRREYASAGDRLRAWRERQRAIRLAEEQRRAEAEAALLEQYRGEFRRLFRVVVSSALAGAGEDIPAAACEALASVLLSEHGGLLLRYEFERRFPTGAGHEVEGRLERVLW